MNTEIQFDFNTLNPGEELRNYLKSVLSSNVEPGGEGFENNVFYKLDWFFKHEGELTSLLYESSVDYLLRRLVKTAKYLHKKSLVYDNYDYIDDGLRTYLNEKTRFGSEEIEKIISLLLIVLSHGEQIPSSGLKRRLTKEAKDNNTPCYICGREINFEDADTWEFCQIDHHWPRKLGGSNKEFNLMIACRKCNQYKEEFIRSSDYHFEQISFQSLLDEEIDHKEFRYVYKLAIWAKSNFRCAICNRSPIEVGPLKFKKNDNEDSWHFLNISAYCGDHFS